MKRPPTPDVLGAVLGNAETEIRAQLRYDYTLIDPAQRGQVQAAAVAIVRSGRKAQEGMIEMGQRLAEVKDMLPHGQFSDWCETEFSMSQRSVQRMMAVAEAFSDEQKRHTVSLFSDSSLYLLAAPSVPEAARDQVIAEAQTSGRSPTKAQVAAVIDQHKGISYATPRQLEQPVWEFVRQWHPANVADQIELARYLPDTRGSQQWQALLTKLPEHWRIADLRQACNNVAEQLRQLRRAAANVTVDDGARAAPTNVTMPARASIADPGEAAGTIVATSDDPGVLATNSDEVGGKRLTDWTEEDWARWNAQRMGVPAATATPNDAGDRGLPGVTVSGGGVVEAAPITVEAFTAAPGDTGLAATFADDEARAFAAAQASLRSAVLHLQDAQRHLDGWHDELANLVAEIIAQTRQAVRELD